MDKNSKRRTPGYYRDASSRAVLPAEETGIGISFERPNGDIIYLYLAIDDAKHFCDAVQKSLDRGLAPLV